MTTVTADREAPVHKPVFSAYEVGRAAVPAEKLTGMTGYEFHLPDTETPVTDIYDLYTKYPELDYLPVVNQQNEICGYVLQNQFLAHLSKSPFARELILRPDVKISRTMRTDPVILDAHTTLSEASNVLMQRDEEIRFDPFVVTWENKFYGIGTVDRVLRGVNYFINKDFEAVLEAQNRLMQVPQTAVENTLQTARYYSPLNGPGGDYVQSFDLSEDYTLVTLLDVCGKGVRAAAMVSVIASFLESYIESLENIHHKTVAGMIERLNRRLIDMTPPEMYATGAFCLVNKTRHVAAIYDFGHGMIWLERNRKVYNLKVPDHSEELPFFGINENLPIKPALFRFKPEDRVLICSDGIVEQRNPEHEMYSTDRVRKIMLARKDSESIESLLERLLDDWNRFRSPRITDDVSAIAFQV